MKKQFISFHIGGQVLAIDVMAIREIRAWTATTLVPHAAPYVAGIVNLRGTALPVIDLSDRLGWGRTDPTDRHAIIVTAINEKLCGLIVDAVSDIVTIDEEMLQEAPAAAGGRELALLEGIVTLEEEMVSVLNLPLVVGPDALDEAA